MVSRTITQQLYIAYFGRPADIGGLENFSREVARLVPQAQSIRDLLAAYQAGNQDVLNLVNSFSASQESIDLYGLGTTASFVDAIYQNIFDRGAESEGLNFWVDAIDNRGLNRAQVALEMMSAAIRNGAGDAITVMKKTIVSDSFTTLLDTEREVQAYVGNFAAAVARDMLNMVNQETDLNQFGPEIERTITELVGLLPPVAGQQFFLTEQTDQIQGTGGDDFIFAGNLNQFGAFASTVTAGDVIRGGEGFDTLEIIRNEHNLTLPGNVSISGVEVVRLENRDDIKVADGYTNLSRYSGITEFRQVLDAATVFAVQPFTTVAFERLDSGEAENGRLQVENQLNGGPMQVVLNQVTGVDKDPLKADEQVVTLRTLRATLISVDGNIAFDRGTAMRGDKLVLNLEAIVDRATEVAVVTKFSTRLNFFENSNRLDVIDLETLNAQGSTGGIAMTVDSGGRNGSLRNIFTGVGNDTITLDTVERSLATVLRLGAGDDELKLTGRGAGFIDIDVGEGDDLVDLALAASTIETVLRDGDFVQAGDGKDTLVLKTASNLSEANIARFLSKTSGIEVLRFVDSKITTDVMDVGASIFASAVDYRFFSGIQTLEFLESTVRLKNVASGSKFDAIRSNIALASDSFSFQPFRIVYGGVIDINAYPSETIFGQGGNSAAVFAKTANINLYGKPSELVPKGDFPSLNFGLLFIGGEVQELNVNLITEPYEFETAESIFKLTGFARASMQASNDQLKGLLDVKVKGQGSFDYSSLLSSATALQFNQNALNNLEHFVTVDLSEMKGFYRTNDPATSANESRSSLRGSVEIPELLKLGNAVDRVFTKSNLLAIDTIEGFSLFAQPGENQSTGGQGDEIVNFFSGNAQPTFNPDGSTAKPVITNQATLDRIASSPTIFDAVFEVALEKDLDVVFFHYQNNTYAFEDLNSDDRADGTDGLVRLIGLFNLDDIGFGFSRETGPVIDR